MASNSVHGAHQSGFSKSDIYSQRAGFQCCRRHKHLLRVYVQEPDLTRTQYVAPLAMGAKRMADIEVISDTSAIFTRSASRSQESGHKIGGRSGITETSRNHSLISVTSKLWFNFDFGCCGMRWLYQVVGLG